MQLGLEPCSPKAPTREEPNPFSRVTSYDDIDCGSDSVF